jgi:integrase
MIERGANLKMISAMLGHADLTMLLKVYGNKILVKQGKTNYMRYLKNHESEKSLQNQALGNE